MLFYAFCAAIVAICLAWLGRIVLPKLPQLALIDTSIIPAVREARKKKELVHGRLHRTLAEAAQRTGERVAPHADKMREAFRGRYRALLELEKHYKREKPVAPAQLRERIADLLTAGADMAKEGDAAGAEKKFIEVLSYDPRRIEAYRGLADLYVAGKRHDRAKETLTFLVKALIRDSRCIHGAGIRSFATGGNPDACPASPAAHADIASRCIDLAAVCEAMGDSPGVRDAYERAVAVEPSNPRTLDLLLEACILGGDKRRAEEVYLQLQAVNPENMKLAELAGRIEAMPEPSAQKARRKKLA